MPGARLTLMQREEIAIGLELGYSYARIASRIGVHRSTVGREVALNALDRPSHMRGTYRAVPAMIKAAARAPRPKPRKLAAGTPLRRRVLELLKQDYSAQQIAGRLRREHPDEPQWWVSHETIYQAWFVQSKGSLRAELIDELGTPARQRPTRLATGTHRKPRDFRSTDRRGHGRDKTPISDRPAEAADRAFPGHWEGDLIIGAGRTGRAAIATVVERASRFTIACLLPDTPRTSAYVVAHLAQTIKTMPDLLFRTLTWDNGAETHSHAHFTMATGIQVYFADPYKPWQRPTNENTNRLIREYLPKHRDLATVTQQELDHILDRLNSRPRKVLNYQTPAERLTQNLAVATTT